MGRAFSFERDEARHNMAKCDGFKNFKKRGEWVEAQFIAQALRKGFRVLKPWGDSSFYDIGVEHGRHFLRMQVKSTSYQVANGYVCAFRPSRRGKRYTTKNVDFFAAYVIPQNVWYLLPSSVVLKTKSNDLTMSRAATKAQPLSLPEVPGSLEPAARRGEEHLACLCHPEATESSASPRTPNEGPMYYVGSADATGPSILPASTEILRSAKNAASG